MLLSPTTAAHVEKSLGETIDLILDAGATPVGIESTVIDLSTSEPTLLRPGTISLPQIEALIGPVATARRVSGPTARASPGMLDRHYAPRAQLVLADANDLRSVVEERRASAKSVGAVVINAPLAGTNVERLPPEPLGYASKLYGALHALDEAGCEVIVVERVPDGAEWLGVRDRLSRASDL
jgi:L-threonylcarbamoyladenylate synthase